MHRVIPAPASLRFILLRDTRPAREPAQHSQVDRSDGVFGAATKQTHSLPAAHRGAMRHVIRDDNELPELRTFKPCALRSHTGFEFGFTATMRNANHVRGLSLRERPAARSTHVPVPAEQWDEWPTLKLTANVLRRHFDEVPDMPRAARIASIFRSALIRTRHTTFTKRVPKDLVSVVYGINARRQIGAGDFWINSWGWLIWRNGHSVILLELSTN